MVFFKTYSERKWNVNVLQGAIGLINHVSWLDLLKINKIMMTGATQKPGESEVQNDVHWAVYKMPISVEQWCMIYQMKP